MVYPTHYLAVMGGTAYGAREGWQCGIRLAGGPLITDPAAHTQALEDIAADFEKFFNSSGAKAPQGCKLTYAKLNQIGPDGKYVDQNNSYTHIYSPVSEGSNVPTKPPQIAVAVTTLTDAEFGRGCRGRFYWLGGAYATDLASSDHYLMQPAERDALAAAAKTLIQDLGNWPGLDLTGLAPHVVSRLGPGISRMITGVRVDDVFDTQRRRAKGMPKTSKTLRF